MSYIFNKLQYYTEKEHSAYALEHLKNINNKLDENNFLTFAIILQNPNLTDKEREVYTICMNRLIEKEKELALSLEKIKSQNTIENDDLCREQNNNIE